MRRLFRYFETEAKSVPSATIQQRMGLTRREQQLIPPVAKGLTNKEIANHFSLSERTIKNHLYRMKHKIGMEDRFSIVHLCRLQGSWCDPYAIRTLHFYLTHSLFWFKTSLPAFAGL
jgi:DNA-binding NarL/FixJ family response regulator